MNITTYDPATGDLREVRTGLSLEDIMPLIGDAPFVEGAHSPLFYRVDIETREIIEKDA